MPESLPWGNLRIRQVYARRGHSLCAVSMPNSILEHLGWKPGMLLTYYPTKDKGLKLILATDILGDREDFDPTMDARSALGEGMRAPRPGSITAMEVADNARLEEMQRSHGKGWGYGSGADAVLMRMEARMAKKRGAKDADGEKEEEAEQEQNIRARRHGKGDAGRGRRRG